METTLTVRARFFSGQPNETRKVTVDERGLIRVWDDVAGHYTSCHSLTRSAERRILKMAEEQRLDDGLALVGCGHAHGGNRRLAWIDDDRTCAQCCGCGQLVTRESIDDAMRGDAGRDPGSAPGAVVIE